MCSTSRGKLATIIKSTSKCIFENLAYEEHIFRTHDVKKNGEILFLWSNWPTVVIGRHQNVWAEVNLQFLAENQIEVARRHSGGGAVYHDMGNLNISLLTTHEQHCRPKNLKFISEALNLRYNLNIVPNKRDDMELQPGNRKCSGTAARIARGKAYHHLTLLVDANLEILSNALRSPIRNSIITNATKSYRAEAVGYLRQDNKDSNVEDSKSAIINAYRSLFESTNAQTINVTEKLQSDHEILKIYNDLKSWKWIYGKSPKFEFIDLDGLKVNVKDGIVVEENSRFKVGDKFLFKF